MDTFGIATAIAFGCSVADNEPKIKRNTHVVPTGLGYVDTYEAKARRVGEEINRKYENMKKQAESNTRKMFDQLYGDWSDEKIKANWRSIPWQYQVEYYKRIGEW